MSHSTTLSAWLFSDPGGAQRTAHQIAASGWPVGRIEDAGVVSWPIDQPRPRAWQVRDFGADDRLSGAFWGLLFASLFLLPLSLRAGPVEKASTEGDRDVWVGGGLASLGLDAAFAGAVQHHVVPGTSALFTFNRGGRSTLSPPMPCDAHRVAQQSLTAEQRKFLHVGFGE